MTVKRQGQMPYLHKTISGNKKLDYLKEFDFVKLVDVKLKCLLEVQVTLSQYSTLLTSHSNNRVQYDVNCRPP